MSPVTHLSYYITPSVSLSVTLVKAASSIQRIKKNSSLSDPQPPPYQDEGSAPHVSSRSRSERGVRRGSSPQHCDSPRCSSDASVDQDTESYLNKGCGEDIPSDSTAVLGPEVRNFNLFKRKTNVPALMQSLLVLQNIWLHFT